jgi:addiction module HigA family antidote
MSANALARHLLVPASRINDILLERRGITADTALRLSRYFGGDALSWLNLQVAFDLRTAELNTDLQTVLESLQPMEPTPA